MAVEKEVTRFGPFAQAIANGVKKGDAIYLSGQVSIDAGGQVVGVGDLAAQVRQAYANVEEVLGRFGATMDDIVDETWFVTDIGSVMGDIEAVFGVRREAYGGESQVAQTLIQIAALVMPELLIEIKCIAHV
jgi:enamine deaminase RidA (YjgF/YER057c/UK114 family)